MKIFNESVIQDIQANKLLKLDLGCGENKRSGFYGLDSLPLKTVDILADLSSPLNLLPENSIYQIYSCHVLEHVNNLTELMREIHRITNPKGIIEIIVPHFSNPLYYSDPTHIRPFGIYSMSYFVKENDQPGFRKVPSFYTDISFKIEGIKIAFYKSNKFEKIFSMLIESHINRSFSFQNFYERRLCYIIPAAEIYFRLRPIK